MMSFVFIFLLVCCIHNSNISQSHVWRVEPPNWWIDMPSSNLQLMIYGDEIGKRKPVINLLPTITNGLRWDKRSLPPNSSRVWGWARKRLCGISKPCKRKLIYRFRIGILWRHRHQRNLDRSKRFRFNWQENTNLIPLINLIDLRFRSSIKLN